MDPHSEKGIVGMHLNPRNAFPGVSPRFSKRSRRGSVGKDSEILFRSCNVMPKMTVLSVGIGVGDPGLLKPLVDQGELESTRAARFPDIITGHPPARAALLPRDETEAGVYDCNAPSVRANTQDSYSALLNQIRCCSVGPG